MGSLNQANVYLIRYIIILLHDNRPQATAMNKSSTAAYIL